MRIAVAFVVVIAACQSGTAQIPISQDASEAISVYEHFFQTISTLDHHFIATDPPTSPALQVAFAPRILFTDQEEKVLKAIVADYKTKNTQFLDVVGPLRMEALFESVDSGQVSERLAKRINELDNEHAEVVADQIQRLKDGFGAARFEVLDAFIRSKRAFPSFFSK
jgi:BioD-like phosphotransacetylase family protein